MFEAPAFERLPKRDRVITLAGLIALCALAWLYIVTGAGLDAKLGNAESLAKALEELVLDENRRRAGAAQGAA